jgi:thioester reductase-like protein
VSRIREEFGTNVPLSFVLSNPTVQQLSDYVATNKNNYNDNNNNNNDHATSLPPSAIADLKFDPSQCVGSAVKEPWTHISNAKNVLLTGATGFLGSVLLEELLRSFPALTVTCIVRGDSDAHARERLMSQLANRKICLESHVAERVVVVCADLSVGALGLEAKQFQSLCRSVDLVFHCAANVNWMLPYDSLRVSNVLPCFALIRLCTTFKRKALFHVSTITCSPMRTRATGEYETFEGFAESSWASLIGPYGQSKWVAEEILRACVCVGLPLCILRPANIMAHTLTGAGNTTDFMHRYLRSAVCVGVAIVDDIPFNCTPVDWVSAAIVKIANLCTDDDSNHLLSGTRPLHLTNNHCPTYKLIGHLLVGLFAHIKLVSYDVFRSTLLSYPQPSQLDLYGVLPLFGPTSSWLRASLANCDVSDSIVGQCGEVTEQQLLVWLQHLKQSKFLAEYNK